MDELLDAISKEQENRFNKPWNKLDKGLKLNRINNYVDTYECTEEKRKELKLLLLKIFNTNILKNDHIVYDQEENIIKNIKILIFKDDKFELTTKINVKNKPKNKSKTKTNIERHFNRSKKTDSRTM